MKSSSFYSLEYIKILKFSQEHTTYSDHSSTSAHPLSVTESLPKLACNKSQPFFESVFVSISWALVLHIWKCLIFPISIYHVPLSPSVLPAKYKIFWENGLALWLCLDLCFSHKNVVSSFRVSQERNIYNSFWWKKHASWWYLFKKRAQVCQC